VWTALVHETILLLRSKNILTWFYKYWGLRGSPECSRYLA
jgi:hypothetical protein